MREHPADPAGGSRKLCARVAAVAASVSLVGSLAACSDGSGAEGEREEIVFGEVTELSGGQQVYGKSGATGLEAAAEEINAEGGISVAGETHDVAVEIVDDRSDPSAVASAAQEVARSEPVSAVGGLSESVAYELWREAGIIMFAVAFELQGPLQEKPQEHPLLFVPVPFYDPLYVANMRRTADLFPEIERVAILAPKTEGGEGGLATYGTSAGAAGMQVVHSALYPPETTDFSAQLTAIEAKSPDLLIALTMESSDQAVAIMQQAAQLGVAEHALNDVMTPTDVLDADGLDSLEVIIPGFAPTFSEAATIPDYDPEAIFGDAEPPAVPGAAIGTYYAHRLLAQAIEQAGTVDNPEAIAEALIGQSYDGPFGSCMFTEEHDMHCEVLVEVVSEGAVEVYRYPGPDAARPSAEYVCRDGSCGRR